MNNYNEVENQLFNFIKEITIEAYHYNVIKDLENIINNSNHNNINNHIKGIITIIKSPYTLLDQNSTVQNNFLYVKTKIDHALFFPLNENLECFRKEINNINHIITPIQKSIVKKLNDVFNYYNKCHLEFKNYLVEETMNTEESTKTQEIFNIPPYLYIENKGVYYIKSLKIAYSLLSYNPDMYEFTKTNENGLKICNEYNNVFYKHDLGCNSLNPSKEKSVFHFNQLLFPKSQSFNSPSLLLYINSMKILSSDMRKKLSELKNKYGTNNVEEILKKEPLFRNELDGNLNKNCKIFLTSSLSIKGKALDKYLDELQQSNLKLNKYDELNQESFGYHVILNLILNHTDLKGDNFIIEDVTNKIICIDYDNCLESDEIEELTDGHHRLCIRNILFTIKHLMLKPVHHNIKEQFKNINSNLLVLNWLFTLESHQKNYDSFFSFINDLNNNETNILDECNKERIFEKVKSTLNIPIQFKQGWITLMIERIKIIKKLIIQNKNYQEILNSIYPYTCNYYNISEKLFEHPNDIMLNVYNSTTKDLENSIAIYQMGYQKDLIFDYEKAKDTLKSGTTKISLEDAINEVITNTEFEDLYDENSNENIINYLDLVLKYLNNNQKNIINFHKSWYQNKIKIFFILLNNDSNKIDIENFVKIFKFTNYDIISNFHQKEIVCSEKIQNLIEFLIKQCNIDIEQLEQSKTLLDLSAINRNFYLVIKLIELGAGKNANPKTIKKYYQSLKKDQKIQFKPYKEKLYNINLKITWEIDINQIFPITKESDYLIKDFINKVNRSYHQWSHLIDSEGKPIISNGNCTNSYLLLIKDEYGNGMYLKFKPQFPSIHKSTILLSDKLLGGDLIPYCEIVSINNIPILLIQDIPGIPIQDILNEHPSNPNNINLNQNSILKKIDSSNISKQIILSFLTCDGDGNMCNHKIVPIDKNKYKLYSTDKELSFMPQISYSTPEVLNQSDSKLLQVETFLFLLDQMNDKVHQDVIDCILNLNIPFILEEWLKELLHFNLAIKNHFGPNIEKLKNERETVIDILFPEKMISQLYSKLITMQKIFKKQNKNKNSNPITHLELLEILQPITSERYKPLILSNIKISEKYYILKNLSSNYILTCSKLPESLTNIKLPLTNNIMKQLWNGNHGPNEAFIKLNSINNQIINLKNFVKILNKEEKNSIVFESMSFEKADFSKIKDQNNKFRDFIIEKKISNISFKNCQEIRNDIFEKLNLDTTNKLDLSGCNNIIKINGKLDIGNLNLKSTTHLKLNNCKKLEVIKVNSLNLNSLFLSNCSSLKTFNIDAINLKHLNLKNAILINQIPVSKLLENLINLETLNISGTNYEEIEIKLNNLKLLDISSMKCLTKVILEIPCIQSLNFEYCNLLKEIRTSKVDYYKNKNLFLILNTSKNRNIINEYKILINLMLLEEIKSEDFSKKKDIITSCAIVNSDYNFLPFGNFECKYYCIFDLKIISILYNSKIKLLILCDGFNVQLSSTILPKQLETLYLKNIKFSNNNYLFPSNLKELYLIEYTQPISNLFLPPNLKVLRLGNTNQPIESLPVNLKLISIYGTYNHEINQNILPNNLKKLQIISNNNKMITIPNHFQMIEIYNNLYQYINLPYKVKDLYIGKFPKKFNIEDFSKDSPKILIRYFDKTKYLSPHEKETVYNYFNIKELKELFKLNIFEGSCIELWNNPSLSVIDQIPEGIENLYLGHLDFQFDIPLSVVNLQLCDGFNLNIKPGFIPPNVKILGIGRIKEQIESGSIPPNVTTLYLHDGFNQSIKPGVIPNTIKYTYNNKKENSLKSILNNIF